MTAPEIECVEPLARRVRWPGFLLFALALAIRSAYVFQLSGSVLFEQPQGDALLHFEMGRQIAAGDWLGDRVFYLAPLYPYFVGLVFRLAGIRVWAVVAAQVLLSVWDVFLIRSIAGRLFGPAAGIVAGLFAACYGPFVFYTGFLLKETLGLMLFDSFVWLVLCVGPRGRWWSLGAPGVLFGLSALVRPNLLPVAVVVLGWLWVARRGENLPRRLGSRAVFGMGVAAAIVPVALRNYAVGGEWVWISAHGGHNFFIGNRPGATGLYEPLRAGGGQSPYEEEHDARAEAERAMGRPLRSAEVSAYWYGRAWRAIASDPGDFLRVTWRKLALFWNDYEIPDFQDFYFVRREFSALWLAPWTLGWLAPLGAYGVFVSRHRWRDCLILYLLIGGIVLSVVPFFVFARYRLPVVPLVIVFAAAGAVELGRRVQSRAWSRLRWSATALIAWWIVFNWRIYQPIDFLATSYFNVGNLYRAAGDVGRAERAWREAVRLNSDYRKPHRALAELLFASGRFAESLESLQRALPPTADGLPADADAVYMLGVGLAHTGRGRDAEQVLRAGARRWPGDARFEMAIRELHPSATESPRE